MRTWLLVVGLAGALGVASGCGESSESDRMVSGEGGVTKTSARARALRRAYDGAPPVIPHRPIGASCSACHDERGMQVPELGFAPPSPHVRLGRATRGLSSVSRCEQCHVYRVTDDLFAENGFDGLAQDLRHGARQHDEAPPVLPHPVFMRENCAACHDGPAAREEVRTSHPERANCRQCHVPATTTALFQRP